MTAFVKAADLGSLTAAANALGLSSQMVSKHVADLEKRLGAQLLHRTTRRQSLTAIGQAFYERCRVVLAETEAAESLVHDLSTTPRGQLRVNAPETFGACSMAPLISRYLKIHPNVAVELTLSDRYVDVVDEGYDAVIRLGPLKDSSLAARALAPHRLVACASPAYLAERGIPGSPDDLTDHECLGFVYASGLPNAEWHFAREGRTYPVPVRGRFRVNDGRVLHAAALDGQGILLQAETTVADDLASGRLVRVLPTYEAPSRPMHILFSARRPQTPKLRTFIDMVVEAFGTPESPAATRHLRR